MGLRTFGGICGLVGRGEFVCNAGYNNNDDDDDEDTLHMTHKFL